MCKSIVKFEHRGERLIELSYLSLRSLHSLTATTNRKKFVRPGPFPTVPLRIMEKFLKSAGLNSLGPPLKKSEGSDSQGINPPKRPRPIDSEDEETGPPLKKIGRKSPSDNTKASVKFLNGLTNEQAQGLNAVMRGQLKVARTWPKIDGGEPRINEISNLRGGFRDGAWYKNWSACKTVGIQVKGRHPQLQVKTSTGTGVAASIRAVVGHEKFRILHEEAATGEKGNKNWRPQAHHIAVNARPDRLDFVLPENLGLGSSISHQCDSLGCVRVEHLERPSGHKKNMDRQRCLGVRLIVFMGEIVEDCPCPHGSSDADDAWIKGLDLETVPAVEREKHFRILNSCIGISVTELSAGAVARCVELDLGL